jgi:hypothetical protein
MDSSIKKVVVIKDDLLTSIFEVTVNKTSRKIK